MINVGVNNNAVQLSQLSNEFVNQVFWGTMLREFRESSSGTLLDGGPGGSAFIRQLDAELIKRISERSDNSLSQALLRQLDPQGSKGLNYGQQASDEAQGRGLIDG